MKSFLQNIGVLTKDGEEAVAATAAPVSTATINVEAATPVVAEEAPVVSIDNSDLTNHPVYLKTLQVKIGTLEGAMLLTLAKPAMEFLTLADKMGRIGDPALRVGAALDITSVDICKMYVAMNLLREEMEKAIASERSSNSNLFLNEVAPLRHQLQSHQLLKVKLEQELKDVEDKIEDLDAKIQNKDSERQVYDQAIVIAGFTWVSKIDDTNAILKTLLPADVQPS